MRLIYLLAVAQAIRIDPDALDEEIQVSSEEHESMQEVWQSAVETPKDAK